MKSHANQETREALSTVHQLGSVSPGLRCFRAQSAVSTVALRATFSGFVRNNSVGAVSEAADDSTPVGNGGGYIESDASDM
jgi:hypothetical protein